MPNTDELLRDRKYEPRHEMVENSTELRQVNRRSLSAVLVRRTLAITLTLGMSTAGYTTWIDLQREKDAVERLAFDFMASVTPSAAAAVYNYDDAAAAQVAEGLFLSRAIKRVTIVNEGDIVVDAHRAVTPTLPQLGSIGSADEIDLKRLLYKPGDEAGSDPIGELSITLDRSLVAPEFVERLLSFFFITAGKNMLFGLLLYWLIFNQLARHISILARVTQSWRPGDRAVEVPILPKFLRRTEVEGLGCRIERLTSSANFAIDTIKQSHDAVVDTNTVLSDTVLDRTRKLEKANARLQDMADHDGLTGLYNRAFFDRHFAEEFQEVSEASGSLSLLLIDVDYFKAFNDFYGHQAGDDALVSVARILERIQSETGCIMARYGGEEFVCLARLTENEIQRFATQIHQSLEVAQIEHLHSTVARRLTVSVGAASIADKSDFDTIDAFSSAADDALYEAKNRGRNQTVVSTPEIRERAQEQRLSLQALLRAIENREFEPYAQPQVDARTGELVGVEVLVRWVRQDGTVIPPNEFMCTAETTGLIKKIDAILLSKVGEFLMAFPDTLPKLSFNVTGESFQNEDYVKKIIELSVLSQTKITIELLETAFIDRPSEQFLWQLDSLREAGVDVEIDDFGTGRTSILGLMAINPNRLKIARELIMPLGEREEQMNLVTSVIEIAHSLGTDVLAEGIETRETANILIQLGCPFQQGYLHGKPVPLVEFARDGVDFFGVDVWSS